VIEDEGPGIPEFAKERIFERFYSLERPDTGRKSTGLGLNFVKEIAALHHGSVQLENRAQGGLRASFAIAAPI
jgi:two-component system sensor histidine kinase CreC